MVEATLQIQLNQIIVSLSNSSAVSSQVCRIPPNNSFCFELYNETDFHQQISDVFLIVFFSYAPIPCLLVSLSFEGAWKPTPPFSCHKCCCFPENSRNRFWLKTNAFTKAERKLILLNKVSAYCCILKRFQRYRLFAPPPSCIICSFFCWKSNTFLVFGAETFKILSKNCEKKEHTCGIQPLGKTILIFFL